MEQLWSFSAGGLRRDAGYFRFFRNPFSKICLRGLSTDGRSVLHDSPVFQTPDFRFPERVIAPVPSVFFKDGDAVHQIPVSAGINS